MTRRILRSLLAGVAFAALCAAAVAPAQAQQRRSILERYQTAQEFEQRRTGFAQNGYFVIDHETCREPDGSALWWVAVYDHQPNPQFTGGFGLFIQAGGWTAFQNEVNQYAAQGWMLEDLDAASNGGSWTNHVAVLNEAQGSSQQLIRENSFASFHANWLAHQGGGLRLTDIDVANINGQPLFYGLMRPGAQDERLIHETTLPNFHAVRTAMEGNGWRIRDIAMQQGEYLAVLYPGSGPTITETFADWAGLVSRWSAIDGNRRVNTRLKDVECWVEGGELRYAGLWRGTARVRRPEGAVPPNVVANPTVTPPPSPQPGRPAAERDPN